MTSTSRLNMRWPIALLAGAALIALGAAAAYFGFRGERPTAAARDTPPAADRPVAAAPLSDVTIALNADALERAGVVVAAVEAREGAEVTRLPAVIEPNAYRQVDVTPLAAGRITRVAAGLGAHVRQGQLLAEIFSPELADAQTEYLSRRAALQAHEQEVQRTEKLAEIGAASRQELERVRAEHTAIETAVQSAAARLALLGRSRAAAEAMNPHDPPEARLPVPAPIGGVVTERMANVGLNVDPAMKLFTVVDLSSVWVVADVYERDSGRVRVGDEVAVTTAAYPDRRLEGRIAYIDPQVNPDTRTTKARVEVPNPGQRLRLGMLAEVHVTQARGGAATAWVPASAVQQYADRTVVYLVKPGGPGQFIEREVHTGRREGDRVEVLTGLAPGDSVVAEGSFHLRAEVARLGLRGGAAGPAAMPMPMSGDATQPGDALQSATIVVNERGVEPARVTMRAGVRARLTFTRVSDKTCATEIVFPSLTIRRELPLNTPVAIEWTPPRAGEVAFACGMNMFTGTVVVQ